MVVAIVAKNEHGKWN